MTGDYETVDMKRPLPNYGYQRAGGYGTTVTERRLPTNPRFRNRHSVTLRNDDYDNSMRIPVEIAAYPLVCA